MITELSQSLIHALGWTLIHSLWQASLIGGIWWLLQLGLRNHSPAVRYNWGWVALLSLLIVSASTFYHHFVPINVFESIGEIESFHSTSSASSNEFYSSEVSIWTNITSGIETLMPWIVMGWFLGTALLGIRMMGGYFYLQQLRIREFIPLPSEWETRIPQLVHKMGITKSISIGTSNWVQEPITWGHFKPIVLLPVGLLTSLTPDQIEALIIHELAHIRRSDFLINLIQSMIEILFFFHPVVWWLSHSLRQEREMCCDDFAVSVCKDAITYADALTRIQSFNHSPQISLAMTAIGKKGQLTARIHRLFISPRRTPSFLQGILAWIVLFGLSSFMWHTPAADERWTMQEDSDLIFNLSSSSTKADFQHLVNRLEAKNIEFKVNNVEFSEDGKIRTLAAKINDPLCDCSASFSASTFEKMIVQAYRDENPSLSVRILNKGKWMNLLSKPTGKLEITNTTDPTPENPAYYIVNGKRYDSNPDVPTNTEPEDTKTTFIWGDEAVELLGEEARGGVIGINTEGNEPFYLKEKAAENTFTFDAKAKDEEPIIIKFNSQTSPADLDTWVEKMAQMEIELTIKNAEYNDRNELQRISGKVDDPICGCNGNFNATSLGEIVITIQRGENSNLSVNVNSWASDGTSAPAPPTPPAPPKIRIRGTATPDAPAPPAPPAVDVRIGGLGDKPLYIVDGEKYTDSEFEKLNVSPSIIESVNVMKGESAREKYGEEAKDGVVIITKKKPGTLIPPPPPSPKDGPEGPTVTAIIGGADLEIQPLFVVNGKQYASDEFEALDLKPEMIESIDVFKGESALKKYGKAGENGVVSIKMKDGAAVSLPTAAPIAPKVLGYAKPSIQGLNLNVFPNPAVDFVNFQFELDAASVTALRVYDLKGNLVASVIQANKVFKKGTHEIVWKTSGVPAGTYVARIELTGTSVPSQAHEGVVFQIR